MNLSLCKCGYDIDRSMRTLKMIGFVNIPERTTIDLVDEGYKFCSKCGLMLYQNCPTPLCENVVFTNIDKECSICKCGVVFCEKCQKVNLSSSFRCCGCNKSLKSISNVYMNNSIDYRRTGTYLLKNINTIKLPQQGLPINRTFSKSVIGDGIMYFWLEYEYDSAKLMTIDIFTTVNSGEWCKTKSEQEIDINVRDINSVEIFDCYIVTCTQNNIVINSAQDMTLVALVDIQNLISQNVKSYRTAVYNDMVIITLINLNNEQEIVMTTIDGTKCKNLIKKTIIDSQKIVDVEAHPIIADGYLYFAGYDGLVYKIDDSFNVQSINVTYPDTDNGRFCICQIIVPDDVWCYLVVNTRSKTYFFNSKNAQNFQKSGEVKRLFFNKVSFNNKRLYLFIPSTNGQVDFSNTFAMNSERFERIDGSFSVDESISDFCIADFEGKSYLLIMKKSNSPYQLKTQRISITHGGLESNPELSLTDVAEFGEFLLHENAIIVCDHKENIITLKDWTK